MISNDLKKWFAFCENLGLKIKKIDNNGLYYYKAFFNDILITKYKEFHYENKPKYRLKNTQDFNNYCNFTGWFMVYFNDIMPYFINPASPTSYKFFNKDLKNDIINAIKERCTEFDLKKLNIKLRLLDMNEDFK